MKGGVAKGNRVLLKKNFWRLELRIMASTVRSLNEETFRILD